jgi:hypothetical protein
MRSIQPSQVEHFWRPLEKHQSHVHEFAGRASIVRNIGNFSSAGCRIEASVGIRGRDNSVNGRVFGTLIRAGVSSLSEKHLAEVKRSLVNAATDGLVPLIAGAFFAAGRSYYQHNPSGRFMAGALGRLAVLWVGDSQAKTSGGPFRIHLQIPNGSFLEDHATWVKPRRSTLSGIHV